jgi:ligand-binding sensor domain-containing protein
LTLHVSFLEKAISNSPNTLISIAKTDTLKFTSGVKSIFQDSKGNYWFGSHGEGVSRFDGKSFQYFTTSDGLAGNQIRSIQEDNHGTIWFGTANGISSYNGKKFTNHTSFAKGGMQGSWLKPANGVSQSTWMKTETDLWFNAGIKEGVYRYDGQKAHYLPFPDSKATITGNTYSVTGISKGKNSMLWFGTFAGVIGYNGSDFTFINDKTLGYNTADDRIHVRSILEDSQGRLWIGNNGIGVLLKEGDSTINFSKKHKKLMPMSKFHSSSVKKQFSKNTGLQSVFAIAEDSNGNIWFGDRDTGAWKYDGKSLTNYTIDKKLSSQMVWAIYEDQNKNILFGMAYGGVYKFNGKSFDRQY